jgi:hypothetical protein
MESKLIYEKIPEIMKQLGAIGKDRKNEFHNYMFRGIDDIVNAIHPIFIDLKVSPPRPIVLDRQVNYIKSKKGEPMVHAVVTVQYTIIAEDGSEDTASTVGEGSDTSDKAVNKAMTSAIKNYYNQRFCIHTKDQADSDNESPELGNSNGAEKKAPPAETKAPPTDGDALADDVKKEIGQIMMTSVNNKPVFSEVDKQKVRAALGTIKSLAGLVSLKDSCQRRLEASIPMKEAV